MTCTLRVYIHCRSIDMSAINEHWLWLPTLRWGHNSQHGYLLVFTETKCGHPLPIDDSSNGGQNLFDHLLRRSFADIANEHRDDRAIALRRLLKIILRLIFTIHLWMLIDGWASPIGGCWRWLRHQRRHHLKDIQWHVINTWLIHTDSNSIYCLRRYLHWHTGGAIIGGGTCIIPGTMGGRPLNDITVSPIFRFDGQQCDYLNQYIVNETNMAK